MSDRLARWSSRSWPYRVRIPLLIIGVSLTTALAIALAVAVSARNWLRADLRAHAIAESQSLARGLVAHLMRDDVWEAFGAVSAVATAAGDSHRDVVVLGRDERVYVSSDPKRFPLQSPRSSLKGPLSQATALSGSPGKPAVIDTSDDSGSYSVIRLPIVSSDREPLGTLLMSYSHSLFAKHYADTLVNVGWI